MSTLIIKCDHCGLGVGADWINHSCKDKQILTLKQQLATAQAKVKELEGQVKHEQRTVIEATSQVDRLQARIKELEASMNSLIDADGKIMMAYNKKNDELQAKVKELEEQVKGMKCCDNCDNDASGLCYTSNDMFDTCCDYSNWQPKEAR